MNITNNKKGMALIWALFASFLLMNLCLSLFFIIKSTSRQVEYSRNTAIALNIAEAGTADAIYRLNYTTGNYPFENSAIPFTNETSIVTSINTIQGNLNGGSYTVVIESSTESDTLTSIGEYKGVKRSLQTNIRGTNQLNVPRQSANQGISEVFNKHAAFAYSTTGSSSVVNGNIMCVTATTIPTNATITIIPIELSTLPELPTIWTKKFKHAIQNGTPDGTYHPADSNYAELPNKVTYDETTDSYSINDISESNETWLFEKSDNGSASKGDIKITNSSNLLIIATKHGNITIDSTGTINNLLYASNNLIINKGTIKGTCLAYNTIEFNGGTISYDIERYKQTKNNEDIYPGFSGGKRTYVPAFGQWRLKQ
jgi:hypothetical protein